MSQSSPDGTWVEYAYDGLDRQVRRQESSGAVTLFFRDQLTDQIMLETNSTGGSPTRYILDSQGEPVASESPAGRGTYLTDPRGNLTHVFDKFHAVQATYAYDPFGKQRATGTTVVSGWDSRLKFQMAPQDPKTKSYSIGPRIFNPDIYRFAGADNFVASASNLDLQIDPLTGNRYLYAGSNPANMIDDGHAPKWLKKAASAVAGFLAKTGAAAAVGQKWVKGKREIAAGWFREGGKYISKLPSAAAAGISAGVGQAAADAFGNYPGRQRVLRGIAAAGIAIGVGAGAVALCGTGIGCAIGAGLVNAGIRYGTREFGVGEHIGLGEDS